jgi:hypothetical protein
MKTGELIGKIPDTDATVLLDFGPDGSFGVDKATWLVGSDPVDTIIEPTTTRKTIAHEFRAMLSQPPQSPDGDAQLFLRDDADEGAYAYFDVAKVKVSKAVVRLYAGAFRCGGGW